MSRIRSALSVFAVNALVLLALLGVLLISPPIVYWAYSAIVGGGESVFEDPRAALPNYATYPWAKKHFEEFQSLETDYWDYMTWRRKDYSGETIHIVDGLRMTVEPEEVGPSTPEFHFYGGSTTWGTGVLDALTYPSLFSSVTGLRAVNHGEAGYIARQSLAALVNFYALHPNDRRRVVVFYDGVNDVAERCRSEVTTLGTGREMQVRGAITGRNANLRARNTLDEPFAFSQTFRQLREFLSAVGEQLSGRDSAGVEGARVDVDRAYRCHRDRARAREVAETLVSEWGIAHRLALANGDAFVAMLQPVAYVGSPQVGHLADLDASNPGLREQYAAVYPEILAAVAKRRDIDFLNLTDSYDDVEALYIDFCHVGPQGHETLVARILSGFQDLGVL